jgi:hypothetical protein
VTKALLVQLLEAPHPASAWRDGLDHGRRARRLSDAFEVIEKLGGKEYTTRLWSRMMNPTHAGQGRQISHHNNDFW